MHCPRCGHEQTSNEIKFCSRCGFQLGLVAELLDNDGFLPQIGDSNNFGSYLTRRNGLIFSLLWFLFFLFIVTPFAAIADLGDLPAFTSILAIFGGLILLLFSLLVLKSGKPVSSVYQPANLVPAQIKKTPAAGELPSATQIPASDYVSPAGSWKAPDTGELARPHSVVDHTTKLLKKD